jgi:hypothetical protein
MYPAHQQFVLLNCPGIDHPQLECGYRRRCDRATRKHYIHAVLPLFAPDRAVERCERQTRARIHRPDNGDPVHGGSLTLGFTY